MLGFAAIDLSERDRTLTVWLTSVRATSRGSVDVGHTNAVCLELADESTQRRAWSMAAESLIPAEFAANNAVVPVRAWAK
jgi:hypothetical protein